MVARSTLWGLLVPMAFGQDVTHAHGFHDGTHGTTGDDTGTFEAGFSMTRPAPKRPSTS